MATIELEDLKPGEADAFGLVQAAVALDQARSDKSALAAALENNMQLWVAIRTLASKAENGMPAAVRDNLTSLASFVADTTMKHGVDIAEETLNTLVNVNLQISEGLLEGAAKA